MWNDFLDHLLQLNQHEKTAYEKINKLDNTNCVYIGFYQYTVLKCCPF